MQCFDVRSCYLWTVPIWCKCLCKHALSEKQQQKTHKNCHKFCWTIYMTVFQQTPAHIQLSFCSLRSLSFRHCIQEMKNCLKLLNRIFSEHLQTSIKNRLAFVNRMTYPRTAVVSSHNDLAYIILNLVWQWTKGMVKYSTFINCITWTFAVDSAAHYAAKNGHLDIIRYLKHEGVNVNAQNDDVRLFPNHCLFSIKMQIVPVPYRTFFCNM